MIEHLKKIISSDLIINDKVYNVNDSLKFPWKWIANIDLFFKDIESTYSNIDNVVIDESNGPVFISGSAIIEPFVIINGPVFIGHNCLIKSHSNISKSIDLPVCLWDERLSTVGAFNLSSQLDVNVSKRVKTIDQNAAAFILQGAIDFLNI